MTRMTLAMLSGLAFALVSNAAPAADFCLRSEHIDHISMTGAKNALARDKNGRTYAITFSAPCGVRHNNVFFVLHTQRMPTCIRPGVFLPTNREAACVVATVHQIPRPAPPH